MDVASAVWIAVALELGAGWLAMAAALLLASRSLPELPEPPEALPGGAAWPWLSVVVPARNEAPQVEPALRSLLAQDYPALEVIAVDDRSKDATGALLDALAAEDARLSVLHVTALPEGWLGKNHALHLGAGRARGELLLFTDADVHFAPGALRAAVAFLQANGLGHAVVSPQLVAPGYWERAFQATFALFFLLRFRVWALRRARSGAYVGMGAFNLVRREDYDRVGGHARLALEVVDDVKLGLLLRRSGVPQALAASGGRVSVRWMPGFRASLSGLMKNLFAGFGYRSGFAAAAAAGLLWSALAPWAVLGAAALGAAGLGPITAAQPWVVGPAAVGALVPLLAVGTIARRTAGGHGLEGLAAPVTHAALAGAIVASAALAIRRGGLVWRDTFYPLHRLRAGCLRERDLSRRNAVGW